MREVVRPPFFVQTGKLFFTLDGFFELRLESRNLIGDLPDAIEEGFVALNTFVNQEGGAFEQRARRRRHAFRRRRGRPGSTIATWHF